METASHSLMQIARDAEARFGDLAPELLNWRPEPTSWSIAQCFDHLIVTQSAYFPVFDRLASGTNSPTAWEQYSPFSGLFGRMLIRALGPDNTRKTKTAAKCEPSRSDLGGDIITRFAEHQADLVGRLRSLPTGLDVERTVITSPLSGFVTYNLADCFTILVVHGRRHLGQAERVRSSARFTA